MLSIVYAYLPAEQKKRFESAGSDDTSKARLIYWEKGLEMMQDHPLTGVGFYNFPIYFDYYYTEFKVYKKRKEVAHNHFVEVGSSLGYPGLITYTLILLICFNVSRKIRKLLMQHNLNKHWIHPFTIGMDCAMLGYIIGAMFMSVAFYPYVWIHISYIVSTLYATKHMINEQEKSKIGNTQAGEI
mgnify:CR=1 FL=1